MPNLNRQIEELLRREQANVRRAFLMAIQNLTDNVAMGALRDALRARDINAAIAALNIEPAAYSAFSQAVGNTYTQAGATVAAGTVWRLPDLSRAVVRFDVTNPRAEEYLRTLSSQKITRLANETREAARQTITAGYDLGRHPNRIALDLAGRAGANGVRQGGIVGLSEPQAQYVNNMRRYLTEDPARALQMTRRDKRFDAAIRRAAETGTPLTQDQIDRYSRRYSDRLLQRRAEDIARTETGMATERARHDTWAQYRDQNGIPDSAIVKRWKHGGFTEDERQSHAAMHNETVRGIDTPFNVGGVQMQYPLDPTAPVGELVNCRCTYTVSVAWDELAV